VRLRLSALAWGWGIDDLEAFAIPSLLQPENLPWLLDRGFDVVFTVYTIDREVERVRAVFDAALEKAGRRAGELQLRFERMTPSDDARATAAAFKRHWYLLETSAAIAEHAPMMVVTADHFYGNGSLRNLAEYCKKPDVVAAVLYLRVKRDEFVDLLARYRAVREERPVSNAQLVDMALRCQIEGHALSNVDVDRNAAFKTSAAIRHISENVLGIIQHIPTPIMFWPRSSDVGFLDVIGAGRFGAFDHLWALKLMAERRWRFLASSDICFVVELTPRDVERDAHAYEPEDGHLYDESFFFTLPHTVRNEMVVGTMRREAFL
jgi:hypothetical protein